MAIYVDCGTCSSITHQVVFDALSHAAVKQINFTFGRLIVNPQTLGSISASLRGGAIGAKSDPMRKQLSPTALAHWSVVDDTFVFGKEMPSRAVVVHEATHALQDRVQFPTLVTQAEATANLAEAIFRLGVVMAAYRITPAEAAKRIVPKLGNIDRIATRTAVNRNLVGPWPSQVGPHDLKQLEDAIAAHPQYKKIADGRYDFDGLRNQ